jgi:transposase
MIVQTSTPTQIRDRKINDLKAQLSNEKSAHRNDKEQFELKCTELKKIIIRKQETIEMLQREISNLTLENKTNKEENQALKKQIAELEDKVAVYEARIKKDSSNSSKPPSSDGLKKPRLLSTREKSGKKPGGQPGHAGHYMKPPVEDIEIIERKEGICPCGGEIEFGKSYQTRRIVDIEIILHVIEERAFKGKCKACGKPFNADFSSQFNAPTKYSNNMASFVSMLNEYGNVPDLKTAEIVNSLCGNKINMSPGTVVNIRAALAKKMEKTVGVIKQRLIDGGLLCVDETGVHVSGKLNWVSVYANDQYTLFEHNQKRSAHCNDEDGILAFFTGILMHDHFKAYYKNKVATHAECNQHILRYLKAVEEIQSHQWAKEMAEFLLNAKAIKDERIAAGENCLSYEESSELGQRYIAILDRGDAEYKAAIDGKKNIRRFREEFCLLRRLREYMDEHLRFLTNFKSPFGNNCSEQSVHSMKRKLRTAGCFRSDQGAKNHMAIASVIATAKKQKKNVFKMIKDTFEDKSPFQNAYH